MKRAVALYRSPTYSPNQHRRNDEAILDAVVEGLMNRGWSVDSATERDVEDGRLPHGDVYVNMCQGRRASDELAHSRLDGALIVNRPQSVLNCHRYQMVSHMEDAKLAFPYTLIVPTSGEAARHPPMQQWNGRSGSVWVKRGDVHAESQEDVVKADIKNVEHAIHAFGERGVPLVAIQEHIPGPVIKFYAVAGNRFFHWYAAEKTDVAVQVNEQKLRDLAFAAAEVLGLEVFGGDAAVPTPDHPVLIDINDWPSFAPVRDRAADAIATYIHERATNGRKT
ncbi:MAG TPA: hypothetical protein VGI83_08460 [Gemmatimonadales bacterium]